MKLLTKLRTELIAVILALVIAGLFSVHVLHFSHRNEAERVVWTGLPFWQTLEAFEYRLYDLRFSNRGTRDPQSRDKIAIVGVDEEALQLAPWPFPRSMHGRVVQKLQQAGARVIVLDFDFSRSTTDDTPLYHAMRDAGNVILPSYITPESRAEKGSKNEPGNVRTLIYRTTTPFEYFDEFTPDLSLAYIPIDSDGRARRYPLYASILDSNVGSMAALASAKFQNMLDDDRNPKYEAALRTKTWPSSSSKPFQVSVVTSRATRHKADEGIPLIFSTPIYFYGGQGTFDTYSYSDVYRGSNPDYQGEALKKKFGGKIVFVGATTHILKDIFEIPGFTQVTRQERDAPQIAQLPGVEIHATATAMLLDGVYIRTQSTGGTLWTLFLLTLGTSLWAASLRGVVSSVSRKAQVLWTQWKLPGQIHTPLWFGLYLVLGTLPVVVFWLVCQWLFTNKNLWVVSAYPLLSASFATGVVLLFLFGVENTDRQKAQTIFARAASPELLAKILASGEDLLRPENKCVTVLFSDLEGFTTYSESHSPQQVIEVANDFLSNIVPIIHRYDGWVDKYIGDAIMAVFGAIIERPDHADVALRCAVEMQDAAAAWRKKTGIEFYMRVGVHTGEVIAGYMGSRESKDSRERMDYTVIGDTVNLASRLEGKNKEFNSWIMCSAQTFDAAPHTVAAESVSAPIKGKSKEVEFYIVSGLKDDPERDKNWAKAAI